MKSIIFVISIFTIVVNGFHIDELTSINLELGTQYAPCTTLPFSGETVNNYSLSTAVPNFKILYVAVAGGSQAKIYAYPINTTEMHSETFKQDNKIRLAIQNAEKCSESSSVSFNEDGSYLAYGCGSSDIMIYYYNPANTSNPYILKQTLASSYNKNGGRLMFTYDGHRLFSTVSMQQINVYIKGGNQYILAQQIPVNMHIKNMFAASWDGKHFAIIQRTDSGLALALFQYMKDQDKYLKLNSTYAIDRIVQDLFINDRHIGVVLGTSISGCSTLIFRINPDGKQFIFEQQIIQQPAGSCIKSGFLTPKNQLILTLPSTMTFSYDYSTSSKKFVKNQQIFHSVSASSIFTSVRLVDTKFWHLAVYTNVGFNLFCPQFAQNYI